MWTSSNSGFHRNLPAAISVPIASSPRRMAPNSARLSNPAARSIVAWALEPRMSCRHSRQSNEMDSVKSATSAAGLPAKRPLRETGEVLFMRFNCAECAPKRPESH